MFLIGDIIELAIQIEQNAETVYRNAHRHSRGFKEWGGIRPDRP